MTALGVLLLAALGMACNLAFAQLVLQPDWALALLLGAMLAHRGVWWWVLPMAMAHDLVMYRSIWGLAPWTLLLPWLMAHLDFRLGPGLPQRMIFMLLALVPVLYFHWSVEAWLLTALAVVPIWHHLADHYAQRA